MVLMTWLRLFLIGSIALLSACEDLHDRKTWAMHIDNAHIPAAEDYARANRSAFLDQDMADCDRQVSTDEQSCGRTSTCHVDTDRYYIACMNQKGWSLIPAFGL